MTKYYFKFWLALFLCPVALAAGKFEVMKKNGQEGVYWVDGQGPDVLVGKVKVIKAGSPLYHWTTPQVAERRTKRPLLDPAEIEALNHVDGSEGGGLYVSLDPFDSGQYGSTLMTISPQKDMRIFEWGLSPEVGEQMSDRFSKMSAALGERNNEEHTILRSLGISATLNTNLGPFTEDGKGGGKESLTWLDIFDPSLPERPGKIGHADLVRLFNQVRGLASEPESWTFLRLLKIANLGPVNLTQLKYPWADHPWMKHLVEGTPLSDSERKCLGTALSQAEGELPKFIARVGPFQLRIADELTLENYFEWEQTILALIEDDLTEKSPLLDRQAIADHYPRLYQSLSAPNLYSAFAQSSENFDWVKNKAVFQQIMMLMDRYLGSKGQSVIEDLKHNGSTDHFGEEADRWWLAHHGIPHQAGGASTH